LSRNKNLSPEQDVQKDVLDIEVGKHRLKIAALESELRGLESLLQLVSGVSCGLQIDRFEFDFPHPENFPLESLRPPETEQMSFRTAVSQSRMGLERSEAFPDLKLGPSFQWEKDRGGQVERYGIALTMELPFLSRNEGGKAAARAAVEANKKRLNYLKLKNKSLIYSKLNTYKQLLSSLEETPSRQELLKKHHRIEKYFTRGLISVSTMLEGHDQLLNLIEERDGNELQALKNLLQLKQAQGQLRETLKNWSQ
jgi:outer membrane protein TolC